MTDGMRPVALGQLAQNGGKGEQGLVDLAAFRLPQHLWVHQQPLCPRHVHHIHPGYLQVHSQQCCTATYRPFNEVIALLSAIGPCRATVLLSKRMPGDTLGIAAWWVNVSTDHDAVADSAVKCIHAASANSDIKQSLLQGCYDCIGGLSCLHG